MLHVGVGVSHLTPGGQNVPDLRIRILLDGIAVRCPADSVLDRSLALQAARKAITDWRSDGGGSDDDRFAHLLSAARSEFGRRGYEATTMRYIASAASLSTGTVYRLLGSKEQLLTAIMSSYSEKVTTAWDAVVRSKAAPLSKLDALMWVTISILQRYSDEVRMSLAWMRQSPPSTPGSPSLGFSVPTQLRQVKSLIGEGIRTGELTFQGGVSSEVRGRCVLEAIWGAGTPVVDAGTPHAAQALARDTVLRGALVRA
jgi:AcrR family transcriptional regulator